MNSYESDYPLLITYHFKQSLNTTLSFNKSKETIFFFFELYIMINVNKNGVISENFCAFVTTYKLSYNQS